MVCLCNSFEKLVVMRHTDVSGGGGVVVVVRGGVTANKVTIGLGFFFC